MPLGMLGLSDRINGKKPSVHGSTISLLPKSQSSLDPHRPHPDPDTSSSSFKSSSSRNERRASSSSSPSPISPSHRSPPPTSKPLSIKSSTSANSRDRIGTSPVDIFNPPFIDQPLSSAGGNSNGPSSSRSLTGFYTTESPMRRDNIPLGDIDDVDDPRGDNNEYSDEEDGNGDVVGGGMGDGEIRSVTHQRAPRRGTTMPAIGNLVDVDEPDPAVNRPVPASQNRRLHAGSVTKMPPEVMRSMTPTTGRLEVTFEATNSNKERMFLLCESKGEDQTLYQITLSTSILRPLCITTILQKGEEEPGQVVGYFEMGMNNKAYGTFKGNRFKHDGLSTVSRIKESFKFVWTPPDLNKELLRWVEPTNFPQNGPSTSKCYILSDGMSGPIEVASFVTTIPGAALGLTQSTPHEQLIIEEIALSTEYSTYLDDIVFSLLIFQRMVSNHRMNVL